MNGRQQEIIEKAIEVFSRYGMRRTTMGDIADHAGISRQTLYASYKNKDEVLKAAIRHVADVTMEEIEQAWNSDSSISKKLDSYLEFAVVRHFENICHMPDSNDLLTGFSEKGSTELKLAEEQKIKMLEKQFRPFNAQLKEKGTNAAAMAEFFESTASNFKYVAKDADHLSRLLRSLKLSTLVMLGEG